MMAEQGRNMLRN